MRHSEFTIGGVFYCSGRQWRCTDIGSRVVVAIRIDKVDVVISSGSEADSLHKSLNAREAEQEGWFKGPPYAVVETVFDEYDHLGCSLDAQHYADASPGTTLEQL